MATLFLECFVRAALIAGGTAAVLWGMRIKAAATRHAAWTAVVIAMLLLPIWSIAGLKVPVRLLPPSSSPVAMTAEASAVTAFPPEHTDAPVVAHAPVGAARRMDGLDVLLGVYLLGVGVLLARLATGTVLALRVRRGAIVQSGIATSERCATPITIGWLKPVAVLPAVWPGWSEAQLRAVLTHEGEHVRRRDPLVQWLALLNRAVFWFHPVAWWLERRLSALAEEACDAAVLAAGYSAEDYSGYLLDLARSVAGRRQRVHIGMAMIGGGLTTRVKRILDGPPASPLSRTRAAWTIAFSATSSILFAAAALVPQTPKPVQSPGQKYDVASIKTCDPGVGGATHAGPRRIDTSPDRLYLECATPETLVSLAYARDGDFVLNDHGLDRVVRGGPDWIRSDRYTLEASTTGNPPESVLMGSMLRALLEERFQLRTHAVSDQIPMYALTVAKDGLKIKPIADGDCVPEDQQDSSSSPARGTPMMAPGQKPPCGAVRGRRLGTVRIWDLGGASLGSLAALLETDRDVVDETGVTGQFNIHLEYALDDPTSGTHLTAETATPTIFGALEQQLGLKLVSTKGPHQYFVIDHIERPAPDLTAVAAASGRPNGPALNAEVRR